MDDIIVFSNNLDDHLGHVRDVILVRHDARITLKLKKCEFITDSVSYLKTYSPSGTAIHRGGASQIFTGRQAPYDPNSFSLLFRIVQRVSPLRPELHGNC